MSAGSRWSADRGVQRGAAYDARWQALAARGHAIHGEADFVCRFRPRSVLDAGCGTGRVAIELAARGIDVVGVDLDESMLSAAGHKAPHLEWVAADLVTVALGRRFDVVALPGNVMIFVRPGTEPDVIANMERHLEPEGVLIAGFQLGSGYTLDRYDDDCAIAGLVLVERFSTWECDPWAGGDYAVSVHRRRRSGT